MKKEKIIQYAKHIGASSGIVRWIESSKYIAKHDIPTVEYEHVLDYIVTQKPRLKRLSFVQATEKAREWDQQLRREAAKIKECEKDTEVVLDFQDGFKIVRLIGENAYKREGKLMRHCVGSYFGKDKEIFSLRDSQNNPHCTIEKDMQIKGKGNGDVHPKYIQYIVDFLKWTGMQVRDSEMNHLGYKRVEFPEFCENKLFLEKYIPENETEKYDRRRVFITLDIERACKYRGKRICLFRGEADFRGSQITDLGELKSIGGNAYFGESQKRLQKALSERGLI